MIRVVPPPDDPYRDWLGVPEGRRPPDHYALLGLERGVADPERIRAAAKEKMLAAKARCLKFPELSTRLQNEIAAALVCLVDDQTRAEYNRTFAPPAPPGPRPAAVQVAPRSWERSPSWRPAPAPPPAAAPVAPLARRRPARLGFAIAGGVGAVSLVVVMAIAWTVAPALARPHVLVESVPPGAWVKRNGESVGQAPVRVALDDAEVTAELPGYEPAAVRAKPGSDQPLLLQLTPLPCVWTVTVDPPSAVVTVDNDAAEVKGTAGQWSITFRKPEGGQPFRVRATKPGFATAERLETPVAGGSQEWQFTLTHLAKAPYDRGRQALAARDYRGAIPEFEAAIAEDKSFAPAFLARATARLRTGDNEGAVTDSTQAMDLDKMSAAALAIRAAARWHLRHTETAAVDCDLALHQDGACALALAIRGAIRQELGAPALAEADTQRAVQIDPASDLIHFIRAEVLRKLNRHDEARRLYDRAIELWPENAAALSGRAEVLRLTKDLREALRACDAALRVSPQDANAKTTRVLVLLDLGNWAAARDECEQWVRAAPHEARSYANLAEVYWRGRDNKRALDNCENALRRNPALVGTAALRARIHSKSYDFRATIKACNAWVRLAPNDGEAYHLRAVAHFELKDYKAAVSDGRTALRHSPGRNDVYRLVGMGLVQLKQYGEAVPMLTSAIDRGDRDRLLYDYRATAHNRVREYSAARKDWERCLELEPTNIDVLKSLAWFLATCPEKIHRDGRQAVRLAVKAHGLLTKHADQLREGQKASILDTLAAAYAANDQFALAFKTQREALESESLAKATQVEYKERLELYRRRQPYYDK